MMFFQLCRTRLLTARKRLWVYLCMRSPLGGHVHGVVLLRAKEQVFVVNAGFDIAMMENFQAVGNRPVFPLPRKPMGHLQANAPIFPASTRPFPKMAPCPEYRMRFFRYLNAGPEFLL